MLITRHRVSFGCIIFACLIVTATSGCVTSTAVNRAIIGTGELKPPAPTRRPIRMSLSQFAKMVQAYTTIEESDLVIEVDLIPNDSGIDKELPVDLGFYARNVLEDIGSPFRTTRTWPIYVLLNRPAGAGMPFVQRDQPKPPPATFRLVGSLLRASELVVVGNDGRIDVAGNGGTPFDGQASGDHRRTISTITIGLSLESPNGLSVRGATSAYKIFLERSERGPLPEFVHRGIRNRSRYESCRVAGHWRCAV